MNQFNDSRIKNIERFINNLQMFLNARYRFDDAYNKAIQIEQSKNNNKRTIEEDFFDKIFNSDFFNDNFFDDYEFYMFNNNSSRCSNNNSSKRSSGPTVEFSIDENGRTHWK